MGLLDDAIREHLDLKRRRGADPTEIAREETEALGPVRRGEVELAATAAPSEAPVEAQSPEPDPDPDPGPDVDAPVLDDHASTYLEPHPQTADEGATPPHGDPLQQATREFSADEVGEALGEPSPEEEEGGAVRADDDVLGATPEFLQETPEHDRLWFEQKPPKDFDF
jgi:hypothetical protein